MKKYRIICNGTANPYGDYYDGVFIQSRERFLFWHYWSTIVDEYGFRRNFDNVAYAKSWIANEEQQKEKRIIYI